jgi:hypothetical protein
MNENLSCQIGDMVSYAKRQVVFPMTRPDVPSSGIFDDSSLTVNKTVQGGNKIQKPSPILKNKQRSEHSRPLGLTDHEKTQKSLFNLKNH